MLTLAASWMTSFRPFTTFHLVAAVIGLLLVAAVCIAGRRLRGTPGEPRLRFAMVGLIAVEQVAVYWYWIATSGGDLARVLPLHPCRLVVLAAAVSLVVPARPLRAIVYFWSLSACCQAILTPQRSNGLGDPEFWFFWISHLAIVGVGLYDITVHRFRPTARDFAINAAVSLAYVAVVLPLDYAFGWDYGYLGRGQYKNFNATDLLPPGPLRPAFLVAAVLLLMWLLLLIWRVPPLKRRAVAPPAPAP